MYEYRVEHREPMHTDDVARIANQQAREGWRFVMVHGLHKTTGVTFVFERDTDPVYDASAEDERR